MHKPGIEHTQAREIRIQKIKFRNMQHQGIEHTHAWTMALMKRCVSLKRMAATSTSQSTLKRGQTNASQSNSQASVHIRRHARKP